jgi:hypothetical protein
MYKVLWLDDQYKDDAMTQFVIDAENNGFILEGYRSKEEGFEALEQRLEDFDLILLDGLFFERKEQEAGTEDESGIGSAISNINELRSRKYFPWFVLSGKDKFTKGENTLLIANKAKCFDKTNPNDVINLFEEMKVAASQQKDAQLKYKYRDLLASCSDQLLGADQFPRLFALIKHIESVEFMTKTEDLLNPIRKIIERMFRRMTEQGVIPETIQANKGWINGSSLFLSNKHSDYEHLSEITPPLISENIFRLLNIIQDASHAEGELKLKVDQYLKSAQSDYLYRSCVFLLFDLLMWFKEFMENNSDKETNKARWVKKNNTTKEVTIIGELRQDNEQNYYVGNHILPYSKVHNVYEIGTSIRITSSSINTKTKPHLYPNFAASFEINQ